jgi:hypothetical protein
MVSREMMEKRRQRFPAGLALPQRLFSPLMPQRCVAMLIISNVIAVVIICTRDTIIIFQESAMGLQACLEWSIHLKPRMRLHVL